MTEFWVITCITCHPSLPAEVREAVRVHIGAVVKAEPISEGRRSALAALAYTRSGRLFLKGARTDDAKADAWLVREAAVNPHVTAISPELVCHVEANGWRVLGFDFVEGRASRLHAGFTGSSGGLGDPGGA